MDYFFAPPFPVPGYFQHVWRQEACPQTCNRTYIAIFFKSFFISLTVLSGQKSVEEDPATIWFCSSHLVEKLFTGVLLPIIGFFRKNNLSSYNRSVNLLTGVRWRIISLISINALRIRCFSDREYAFRSIKAPIPTPNNVNTPLVIKPPYPSTSVSGGPSRFCSFPFPLFC